VRLFFFKSKKRMLLFLLTGYLCFCNRYVILAGDSCNTISVVPNANNPQVRFKNITQAQFEDFNQQNCGPTFPPQPGNYVCISEGGLPPIPTMLDNGFCSSYRVREGDSCDSIANNDTFLITKDQIQNFNNKVCGPLFPTVNSIICLSEGQVPRNAASRSASFILGAILSTLALI
jgi:LysM domain